jgi:hypothetical protein
MNNAETAYQVAGHVVMVMLWGVWRVDKISLAGTGNVAGGIEYARGTETEGKELRQRLGTKYFDAKLERMLAGPVTQAILLDSEVVHQAGTGDSDFDSIVGVIQDGFPGSNLVEARAVIHAHELIVQADLKRMWPVVEALARALMGQKELTDHEIRAIVRTAVNKLPENERLWAVSRLRNPPSHS